MALTEKPAAIVIDRLTLAVRCVGVVESVAVTVKVVSPRRSVYR